MSRVLSLVLAAFVGWNAHRACSWWVDNVPSHNCEETS